MRPALIAERGLGEAVSALVARIASAGDGRRTARDGALLARRRDRRPAEDTSWPRRSRTPAKHASAASAAVRLSLRGSPGRRGRRRRGGRGRSVGLVAGSPACAAAWPRWTARCGWPAPRRPDTSWRAELPNACRDRRGLALLRRRPAAACWRATASRSSPPSPAAPSRRAVGSRASAPTSPSSRRHVRLAPPSPTRACARRSRPVAACPACQPGRRAARRRRAHARSTGPRARRSAKEARGRRRAGRDAACRGRETRPDAVPRRSADRASGARSCG